MALWKFSITGNLVQYNGRKRRRLNRQGCNEPFRDRYWCPMKNWFSKEPCPFINRHECQNFASMSGERFARR